MATRVLITGGAGFIGSHLVEACLGRGYEVRVLDNLSLGSKDWIDPAAEVIQGDIRDLDTCREAVLDCTGVFHLAAMSRAAASLDNVDICTSNNIIGTQNILHAAREASVKKIVYSGSSTFYGNLIPPHREDMRADFLNFYGLSKHVGEEYCLLYDKMYGLPCIVLRYFNVYGPRLSGAGQYALVMSIFLEQFREGKPLTIHGNGEQSRDFVHVRDVAEANILAFESNIHGRVYNVGTGIPISVKELANRISTNQIHEPRRAGDAEVTLADISRICEELGWSPAINFEDGLRELLQLESQHNSETVANGAK